MNTVDWKQYPSFVLYMKVEKKSILSMQGKVVLAITELKNSFIYSLIHSCSKLAGKIDLALH